MQKKNFIIVSGYFSSGSSAVVDLLKEFAGTYECQAEFRIIKDPYGILQMENALVAHWELINSSASIRDFLQLCKICNRDGRFPLAPAGLAYSKMINKDFLKITEEYIAELTKFTYKSDFYYSKFKKKYPIYVIDRCRWAVEYLSKGKIKIANRNLKPSYFSIPTQNEFNNATKKYLLNLFNEKFLSGKVNHIILDQAISPNNPEIIHRYFNNAKMIVVDRDPRDIFIDDMRWVENLDPNLSSADAGMKFVIKHRALRRNSLDDPDILYIRFEDLILNYEQTVSNICQFLEFTKENHINYQQYLKPSISSKNIGKWKNKYGQYKDAIDIIKNELPEYCID